MSSSNQSAPFAENGFPQAIQLSTRRDHYFSCHDLILPTFEKIEKHAAKQTLSYIDYRYLICYLYLYKSVSDAGMAFPWSEHNYLPTLGMRNRPDVWEGI